MKILHTSDWHLGHKFKGHSRKEEHEQFFKWLVEIIEKEQIDLLIVAGDIFDSVTPPTYSSKLYFDLLSKLAQIKSLKQTVVISGNHDSIPTILAPKDILNILNINILADGENIEDEIIEIPNLCYVCAVPYLRDNVLKKFQSDESIKDRNLAIKTGLKNHYLDIYEKVKAKNSNLPIIATGHLTTTNCEVGDGERELYIGNLEGVESSIFPNFDYIALGHIHKFQKVGENIFYSGSPIPLTFKEAEYKKYIIINDLNLREIRKIEVPIFREIISIKTKQADLKNVLSGISKNAFVEINMSDDFGDHIISKINDLAQEFEINVVAIKFNKKDDNVVTSQENSSEKLLELSPIEIFLRRIDGISENREELINIYKEILNEVMSDENLKTDN